MFACCFLGRLHEILVIHTWLGERHCIGWCQFIQGRGEVCLHFCGTWVKDFHHMQSQCLHVGRGGAVRALLRSQWANLQLVRHCFLEASPSRRSVSLEVICSRCAQWFKCRPRGSVLPTSQITMLRIISGAQVRKL